MYIIEIDESIKLKQYLIIDGDGNVDITADIDEATKFISDFECEMICLKFRLDDDYEKLIFTEIDSDDINQVDLFNNQIDIFNAVCC